jgi:hypothetical protein
VSRCSRVLPKLCTVFSGVTKCTFRWGCVSRPSPNTNPPCDLLLVRSRWYTNHYVHFWGVKSTKQTKAQRACGLPMCLRQKKPSLTRRAKKKPTGIVPSP